MTTDINLISLLGQALTAPMGIVVTTNNPERLRTRLYKLKKSQPEFAVLKLEVPVNSPTNSLWIVNPSELSNV